MALTAKILTSVFWVWMLVKTTHFVSTHLALFPVSVKQDLLEMDQAASILMSVMGKLHIVIVMLFVQTRLALFAVLLANQDLQVTEVTV